MCITRRIPTIKRASHYLNVYIRTSLWTTFGSWDPDQRYLQRIKDYTIYILDIQILYRSTRVYIGRVEVVLTVNPCLLRNNSTTGYATSYISFSNRRRLVYGPRWERW